MSATGKIWGKEAKLATKTLTNTITCGCFGVAPAVYGTLTLVYLPIAVVLTPFTLTFDMASCICGSKNSKKE